MSPSAPPPAPADDPYAWLEDIDGTRAMDWVKAHNADSVKELGSTPEFEKRKQQILEVLDSEDRIPDVVRRGEYLYNLWQDREHPRGLWRRTTLPEYRKEHPAWETVLDVDALGKAEKESWVWHGAECLKPDYRHCLVSLSRGGADADVVREFDIQTKTFVPGGFSLPEAKSRVSWIDPDHLFVGTDFGPGSMTQSGYPRISKLWKRGTPLASAALVYEGKPEDLAITAGHDATPGFERSWVTRTIDFFSSETFLRNADGTLTKLDIPLDAEPDANREWLLIKLRTAWTVGGHTYPSGALLAAKLDDFLKGKRELTALFTPTDTTSLNFASWTKNHLLLNTLKDVVSQIEVLTPGPGAWKREPLGGTPPLSTSSAGGSDPDHSDEYFLSTTGFLMPATLSRGVLDQQAPEVLKHAPSFFDASHFEVSQGFATSKDGTRVPYFVIAPKGLKYDGANPTLLYGYGGFEISLQPAYSGGMGRVWLSPGGVYVVANIRGGGEYGPRWHQAALKEHRMRAYEDFAAVAQELIARKITSPPHLGVQGGSNGGLLVGNMLTHYPQLFGAVVCQVALLDMKRYTHLSAGASWIAEYGDPDQPEQWAYIRTFSPYHNAHAGTKYPPSLFTTSTRDDRVGPVHARKMAARMMELHAPTLFYENIEGGHGAAADHAQAAFMNALGYTFLWKHLK